MKNIYSITLENRVQGENAIDAIKKYKKILSQCCKEWSKNPLDVNDYFDAGLISINLVERREG